ncbi:MAG: AraC family transcriptional regulator [Blastocatellia bacterium]|nr:AraC family transcriptional regulator [Blastocatellia bacterium]
MILTLQSTRTGFRPAQANLLDPQGRCTHIISATGRSYFADWAGGLSLKSFSKGRVFYDTGTGRYAVDDGSYLILNEGQPYRLTIDSPQPVESFCLFFEAGFAQEVRRALTAPASGLLDDPDQAGPPVSFVQRLYPRADLPAAFHQLRTVISQHHAEPAWMLEQLHEIMAHLLGVQTTLRQEMERLPAVRAVTREELYRRVYRARDFMAATSAEPLTLTEIAKVACLSPNHFLRTFKQIFGQSPHQYLTGLRLEHACRLLQHTDLPVTEICLTVGFESQGSFSWLFRGRMGVPPMVFRQQKR